MWQPIETCPKHRNVLLYREDAGVFQGQYTYCETWLSEDEQERLQKEFGYSDDEFEKIMFKEDFWSFEHGGMFRLEDELIPTHWRPMPEPPELST